MVTFAQLRDAKTESFRDAATAYRAFAGRLGDRVDSAMGYRSALGDLWEGIDAEAAQDAIRRRAEFLQENQMTLQRADQIMTDFVGELVKSKALLSAAIARAEAIPAEVDDTGTVHVMVPPSWGDTMSAARMKALEGMKAEGAKAAEDIADAVRYANKADAATAKDLRALKIKDDAAADVGDIDIPKQGADPKDVQKWWSGLSDEEQQALIALNPDKIGALDGVDAESRDQANRLLLDRMQDDYRDRLDELTQDGKGDGKEADAIRDKLEGLDAIEERLAAPGGDTSDAKGMQSSNERAYLLRIDPNGNGRAIVAVGNPDTADNVVTYVPGTFAELGDGIGSDINRVDRMVYDANQLDPTQKTAGVMWLGYDAPQNLQTEAIRPKFADAAEEPLRRFQDGLRVTQGGAQGFVNPANNTVIGHSYGSTVIGHAASGGKFDVNQAIFVGSPGVGVDSVDKLGIGADNVYSSHADHDIIKPVAKIQAIHSGDPSAEGFGAHRFDSDPGTKGPWYMGGLSSAAHSEYWTDGNESRDNIAKIVTGNGDAITGDYGHNRPAPHPGEMPTAPQLPPDTPEDDVPSPSPQPSPAPGG